MSSFLAGEAGKKATGARGQWFYGNALRSARGSLDSSYQGELLAAVRALSKLSAPTPLPLLEQFIKDFSARFEQQKVPLMEALDPETGVGYGSFASQRKKGGLLKDIDFPEAADRQRSILWSDVHRLLLDKWKQLTLEDPVIRLHGTEIAALPEESGPFPPGLSIIFRLTDQGLLIENAGGATATSLAGRFTALSREIHELIRASSRQESAANPGVIFADIGQLSDSHSDNINRREIIYDYEIAINSSSLLPREHQLFPSELVVSVRDGMIILESTRLKTRVIPRLATAYNFRHNHLALFRFLCDLQFQGVKANLGFNPEAYFPGMDHYPRVQFENTILSPARWQVGNEGGSHDADSLRHKLHLPRCIALTRFDQQLTFDLDNPADRKIFNATIATMPAFTLEEGLLPDKEKPVVTTRGGRPMVNQFITMLVNPNRVYQPIPYERPQQSVTKREFILGSDWLYYKIYCEASAADDLLRNRVFPIIQKLSKTAPLEWFFVRYNDPGYHIRLRIKISHEHTALVIRLFKKHFSVMVKDRLVREFQTDTYRRELERYGHELIKSVEGIFCASSQFVLGFIRWDETGAFREQSCLYIMQQILDLLAPGRDAQIGLIKKICDNFIAEFRGGKPLKVALDLLYRERRKELFSAHAAAPATFSPALQNAYNLFIKRLSALSLRGQKLTRERRERLAADLIHMHVSRMYTHEQRRHELALYYCLYKYHLSLKGMTG